MKQFISVLFFISFFTYLTLGQTGPAGVGGHEDDIEEGEPINALWLRASDLLEDYADQDPVMEWNDISGYDHVAEIPAGRDDIDPGMLEIDKINGFPWVTFNGNSFYGIEDHEVLDGGAGIAIFTVLRRSHKPNIPVNLKYNNQTVIAKRKHWNAWSHQPEISLDAEGLQHAYEMRFDVSQPEGSDESNWSMVTFLNGNLPDGNGQDVFTDIIFNDTVTNKLIGYVYNDIWGGTIRVDGFPSNSTTRQEGNPNPIYVGNVINSTEPVYIGAAELDPTGDHGHHDTRDDPFPDATEQAFLDGHIAELIVFKGILDSTKMILVENYLNTRYHLNLEEEYVYYFDSVYIHDVIGIGTATGRDVHTHAMHGPFGLEALNESLDAPGEFLLAGHTNQEILYDTTWLSADTLERWSRDWKLEKTGDLDAILSFNFSEAGLTAANASENDLLYRETDTSDFHPLGLTGTIRFRVLRFEVPNDQLKTGFYTVGHYVEKQVSGIDYKNLSDRLLLFPNPVSALLSVKILQNDAYPIGMEILDYTGKILYQKQIPKNRQANEITADVSFLPEGTYFVRLQTESGYAVKPFVKE